MINTASGTSDREFSRSFRSRESLLLGRRFLAKGPRTYVLRTYAISPGHTVARGHFTKRSIEGGRRCARDEIRARRASWLVSSGTVFRMFATRLQQRSGTGTCRGHSLFEDPNCASRARRATLGAASPSTLSGRIGRSYFSLARTKNNRAERGLQRGEDASRGNSPPAFFPPIVSGESTRDETASRSCSTSDNDDIACVTIRLTLSAGFARLTLLPASRGEEKEAQRGNANERRFIFDLSPGYI